MTNSVYPLANVSVTMPWLTASLHSILFAQEYLESSLRYLHHKFVADVGEHRTENIKASMKPGGRLTRQEVVLKLLHHTWWGATLPKAHQMHRE